MADFKNFFEVLDNVHKCTPLFKKSFLTTTEHFQTKKEYLAGEVGELV